MPITTAPSPGLARQLTARLGRIAPRLAPRCAIRFQTGRIAPCQTVLQPIQPRRLFHNSPVSQQPDPIKHSPRALLPEFSLKDKVIVVSGGAQGLGLVQTEALLEAGATGM
jgi:UDP-N-acetylglucosamine:LPS N-acetylglucosamine transferase